MADATTTDDRPSQDGVDRSFSAALRAAESAPESEDGWDHLEELAAKLQRPDEVATVYVRVLEQPQLGSVLFRRLAERAVQFHEEWFGDTPEKISAVLGRVTELDPEEDWAFEKLSVMLTAAEQWDPLLALYDRTLGRAEEPERRRRLLNDAAQVAKDFADQPDRAAGYLQQLLALEPANLTLVTSLERLLERLERWRDLIELWQSRIPELGAEGVRETRVRVASCWLERLGEAESALDELRTLLNESPGHERGCELCERILALADAGPETRRAALALLRNNYLVAERPEDVVRVLGIALGFVDETERRALYRELATRLAILGRDSEAMEHYAALLVGEPNDPDARKQLRQLAKRSGKNEVYARALGAAAEACDDAAQKTALLLEAADLHRGVLSDAEGAIDRYHRILATEEAEESVALAAAHGLDELLAAAARHEERLAVLERLAGLEKSPVVRRFVHSEAARLADKLGDADRALANWQPVLGQNGHDLEALAAVVELLEQNRRWPELADALRRRAEAPVLPLQRRADLVRLARVLAGELEQLPDAIEVWLQVKKEFGEDAETLAALDDLFASTSRWNELAELLGDAARLERARAGSLLTRLGDVLRGELGENVRALEWYEKALAINPPNAAARSGLEELLEDESCRRRAAEALARAYGETDDWQLTVGLLDHRLACSESPARKAQLLREAAELARGRAADERSALSFSCRALALDPDSLGLQAEIERLASRTEQWLTAAGALGEAAAATTSKRREAELHAAAGRIHEQLGDAATALASYQAAASAVSDEPHTHEAIARTAALAQQWDVACAAALRAVTLRDRVPRELCAALEAGADSAWSELATAMAAAVAAVHPRAEIGQQLELIIAGWWRDRAGDLDAAEAAARRAVDLGPRKIEALRLLAELERRHPDSGLLLTLLQIDAVEEHSLDVLFEAAKLALELQDDVVQTQSVLEQLYRKAGGMWLRAEPASGRLAPNDLAVWALDKIIGYHVLHGNAARAVHVLMEGSRLPLAPELASNMRRRAAEMLAEAGERGRAIEIYRGVLEAQPQDLEALRRVAELCESEGRVAESLDLRLRELERVEDPDRRLELRLEHSRLTGLLEERGGRVAALRANLSEKPGHEATVAELVHVLDDRGKYQELCEVLGDQASQLEQLGEAPRAAGLWARVAELAEKRLRNPGLAVAAHSRVVALAPTSDALDALARLSLERDEPAQAARWLEQRLEATAEGERVAVLLKLARARLQAEQRESAIEALETAFREAPRNAEVRKLLLGMYRSDKNWTALAGALTTAAQAVSDEATVLAYAREAGDLFHQRLGAPEQSVPVLRRALEIAPDERDLKPLLAEALRAAGELGEARTLLEALIADFGRRRSPERAALHLQLARVAHAQGSTDAALDELESASKMDPSNVTILHTLADLALTAGQLERSERAYRTLLITVRREDDPTTLPIGPTEVLLELCHIAGRRGQPDKATELIESVLESLGQHDFEAPRIQAKLQTRGDHELLLRVLETRLRHVTQPHRRAGILADKAALLETLGRTPEAVDAALEAVKVDPSSPAHHQAARDLAARSGTLERYVSEVEALLSDERADNNAHVRCELLLRLGEVLEKERNDLGRAAELYRQAETTGVRKVDVWRAQARIAGARGDGAEEARLLGLLASLGEDQAETRADALFRLAEVQLAAAETLAEGLTSLGKALEDDVRTERAGLILRRSSEQHPESAALLDVYERVARKSSDKALLLHYLERRATHPDATPEHAREAVELALERGEPERAEKLMLRAADIGKSALGPDGLARVDWALLGLAERRKQAGDIAGAVKWFGEAAEVAELPKLFALGREVAELAADGGGDLTLAAKLYERLLERTPTAREAWQPLALLYARLGDVARLERMVEETLDALDDPADRTALRVALARALLASDSRAAGAVAVLQEVLLEDPEQREAQGLLVDYLEKSGRSDELVDLLGRQLQAAEVREDLAAIKVASLRLARRVGSEDPERALSIYRAALGWMPNDAELLTILLDRLGDDADPRERAELSERLLTGEQGEAAGARALALMALYESLDPPEPRDGEAVLRVLKLGYERAPDNAELRARLQHRYRERGDFSGLSRMLLDAAERQPDGHAKLVLLREAAQVQRDQLGEHHAAAELLAQARALAPSDLGLCTELATTLAAAGDYTRAIDTLTTAFAEAADDATRLELLVARAAIHGRATQDEAVLADLEQAFAIDPERIAAELEAAHDRRRAAAESHGDRPSERRHLLRGVEMRLVQGRRRQAAELLTSWIERADDDLEALRRLRDIESADGHWDAVALLCERLVEIEQGSAQIDAALALTHACYELDQAERARDGLELVHRAQPDNVQIRAELRKLCERLGDRHKLAGLLVLEAKSLPADQRVAMLLRAGQLFVELGDAVSAVPALRGALEGTPGDPLVIAALADAYILAGWFDDANELLDESITAAKGRRTPEICTVFQRKAQVAEALGDKRRQLDYLQEAHLCAKKNGDVAAALANLAEELGEWDLAARTLRTITLIDTECPISRAEAFYRQGRICLIQGDDKSARMWARRARREDPESPDIEGFLRELGEAVSIPPGARR